MFNNKQMAMEYLRKQSFLRELPNGSFVYGPEFALQEGETNSPHFYPTRYKGGWFIKVIHFYKYGRFTKREDGKCFFKGNSYVVHHAM